MTWSVFRSLNYAATLGVQAVHIFVVKQMKRRGNGMKCKSNINMNKMLPLNKSTINVFILLLSYSIFFYSLQNQKEMRANTAAKKRLKVWFKQWLLLNNKIFLRYAATAVRRKWNSGKSISNVEYLVADKYSSNTILDLVCKNSKRKKNNSKT